MDPKRRVSLTIDGKQADRFPRGELLIDDAVQSAYFGSGGITFRHRLEFAEILGLDLICLQTDYGPQGTSFQLPVPDVPCWKDLDHWREETDLFLFALLDGGFSWCAKLLGFTNFMIAIGRCSAEVDSLVRQVEALNSDLIRRAASQGVDGIVIADDIAYSRGLMIGPEMLRRIFLPSLARQVRHARECGLRVFFHSDGNLEPVIDDLVDSGIDGLQCIEKAAGMDLDTIQKRYGEQLCLWGNLDPAILTEPFDPTRLEAAVAAVTDAANRGGVIFGTSSGLFKGMGIESIRFVYELLRQV